MGRLGLPDRPEEYGRVAWTGLAGSSIAMALAHWVAQPRARTVVLCPQEDDVRRILEDTSFFFNLLGIHSPPRVLPYPARLTDLDPTLLPEPHVGWQRLSALHHLLESSQPVVLVTTLHALGQRTIPKSQLLRATELLMPGAEVRRDELSKKFVAAGYELEPLVEEPGSFAVRGGILDFYPPHTGHPFRIEFVGDTVESIRKFDPASQRSLEPLEEATWIPCREVLPDPDNTELPIGRLKELADDRDLPRSARSALDAAIDEGRYLPAFDSMLPLFYTETGSLLDYLQPGTEFIGLDPFGLDRELGDLEATFKRVGEEVVEKSQLAFRPQDLSEPIERLRELLHVRVSVTFSDIELEPPHSNAHRHSFLITPHHDLRQSLLEKRKQDSPLRPLFDQVREWRDLGLRTLFLGSTETETQRLAQLLRPGIPDLAVQPTISPESLELAESRTVLVTGRLSSGFRFEDEKLVLVTDADLFGERKHAVAQKVSREDMFASLSELSPGDLVVHIDHGVGRYVGLERMQIAGISNDFLHLEYAGGDKLYLPIYRLNRVQRYVGSDGAKPHLDKLGNQSAWAKTQQKAKKAVEEMAEELIQLYAARKVAEGTALGRPDETYMAFEADFPYEETPDQLRAIEEVSADLETTKPMDRLICGDVGFGKTEVALRAAFRAAMEGYQVAVLVPTTILAQQHFETFQARLKESALSVEVLSRFRTTKEQKETVARLKSGQLDIVVGTHRLLSKDVAFHRLGLLVIDEEHRFGVKHKERIKQFRNKVDVLTLTATPIPRTLQMSMAGIRDLSVINTPPLDRKSIHTVLCKFEDTVIRGAIMKELERGGQAYFVHNRVETIFAMKQYLQKLVPKARIEVGHGQMSEKLLEATMHRFIAHEFDVLLCTTIIESGIDVPNANTLLINRADMFGLAQLYQLRGRVGRSPRPAYAYLLVPGEELITRDALKRLKVLKRFTELGSGLKIALHDLEIRGAGNLLGASQSGHIAAIGFELYTQLLEREVRKLKGEHVEEEIDPEVSVEIPAFLPEEYIGSTGERLSLYKRLAATKSEEDLETVRRELIDRFGVMPLVTQNLFRVIEVKILARRAGVLSLRLTGLRPTLEFSDRAAVHIDKLLKLIKKDHRLSFRPDQKLVIELEESANSLDEVKNVLNAIVAEPNPKKST